MLQRIYTLCSGYHATLVGPFYEEFQVEGFCLLKDIIHICKIKRIHLILVTAPMYKEYKKIFLNCEWLLSWTASLAEEEKIPYFNMIDDSQSMRKENIYNFVHFFGAGARIYSVKLAAIIQSVEMRRTLSKQDSVKYMISITRMLFNSLDFLLFFPLVTIIYFILPE